MSYPSIERIRKTLIVVFLFVIAGCTQKTEIEDFDVFLNRFLSDKPFAMERTMTPLVSVTHEYGVDDAGNEKATAVESTISRKVLEKRPTLMEFISQNNLSTTIETPKRDPTARIVKIFGEDTDWLLEYRFINTQGLWYLNSIHDYSL